MTSGVRGHVACHAGQDWSNMTRGPTSSETRLPRDGKWLRRRFMAPRDKRVLQGDADDFYAPNELSLGSNGHRLGFRRTSLAVAPFRRTTETRSALHQQTKQAPLEREEHDESNGLKHESYGATGVEDDVNGHGGRIPVRTESTPQAMLGCANTINLTEMLSRS